MMQTLKVTVGSPELMNRLQTDVLKLLDAYTKTLSGNGLQSAAEAAIRRTRVTIGDR